MRPGLPDAQGQAALILVESLIHGLIEQSILPLGKAVEIIDAAIDVQTDIAVEADRAAGAMWQAQSILLSMAASLRRDLDAMEPEPR